MLNSLTVIGSKNLSVTLNDSAAVATIPLTTVDASGFTGDSLTISAVEADSGVTVTTGSEALTVTVGDGANDITGTGGNDSITTGSGADTIVSYGGDDTISAGDGANVITATDGENNITGGEGIDTITAGNGNNTITGGDGADVLLLAPVQTPLLTQRQCHYYRWVRQHRHQSPGTAPLPWVGTTL